MYSALRRSASSFCLRCSCSLWILMYSPLRSKPSLLFIIASDAAPPMMGAGSFGSRFSRYSGMRGLAVAELSRHAASSSSGVRVDGIVSTFCEYCCAALRSYCILPVVRSGMVHSVLLSLVSLLSLLSLLLKLTWLLFRVVNRPLMSTPSAPSCTWRSSTSRAMVKTFCRVHVCCCWCPQRSREWDQFCESEYHYIAKPP
mmetsp:Transcript_22446/g.62642  ORF Transcript_22446/g.62642 Transcript_22446/m.62642 type:complete len:200 (+) Transcript_22446:432-1031(+)